MKNKESNMKRTVISFLALALLLVVASTSAAVAAEGVVNINTASADQLQMLPRVGPAVAQRIVEFRSTNGEFKALEELMLVQGVGDKTFDLIKPYVTISGQTTLGEKVSVPRPGSTSSDA